MKPLHPTHLATAIRSICNAWPSFSYIKPKALEPKCNVLLTEDYVAKLTTDEEARLAHQLQRQAYLQSIGKGT